jgi:hypothetical protein
MRYVPRQWRVAFPIVLVALIALAVVMIVALLQGALWAAAVSGGAIAGILLAISLAMRHFVPGLSAAFLGGAAVPATLLWLMSPGSGIGGLGVAAVVLGVAAAARRHATSLM